MDVLGFKMKGQVTPIDGVSLMPLIEGKMTQRPRPIGFESSGRMALIDNRYKIYGRSGRGGKRNRRGKKADVPRPKGASPGGDFELYDLIKDPGETTNIAAEHPDIVKAMSEQLLKWRASCKASNAGGDYK
jgi:hypothetical protein